ncbi:MAG TPA: ATP-binding protein [Terriglobales bacterium]|nr:ATP-binding protein [Terriglobales bacterium]
MLTDNSNAGTPKLWTIGARSLSAKLVLLLGASMTVVFGVLGYLNIRLNRQHLEAATLLSAERVSDVIKRSTTEYMLRNDREGLYHSIQAMADEPGVVKIRIFDQQGKITYTTDLAELNHVVDKNGEACYGCHNRSQPLTRLDRPDRFRIYRSGGGSRVLGIITPIENQPACSNAACHAHPAEQKILGVLDTDLSLAKTDVQLADSSRRMVAYTIVALLVIAFLIWLFVWRVVGRPIHALTKGTELLSAGGLGFQIKVDSQDEVGDLARSFNNMSLQLRDANDEILAWTKTLEERVDQKSRELKNAHEHALHIEKMASIGKMAAVVAHEINNPLSGILTYAKLLHKWIDRGEMSREKHEEALQCLDLIAGESRRCGDLVKNLLTFSRTAPMNIEATDLNAVVERSVRLAQHQMELNGIQLHLDLPSNLPRVACDPAQIEQVLIALVMNALDAMPRGGNLWLQTREHKAQSEIEIQVRDDGTGIPPEILPQIFEPFLTTKDSAHGVGLGLAISHGIIERHNGRIQVQSESGKGTTFTITLPLQAATSAARNGKDLVGAKAR